jgi:tRNA (guanine10-N2)-methyltransferase
MSRYTPEDIPSHSKMRVIANSEQNFGKWSRRLVTMEKIDSLDALAEELVECAVSQPGHSNFREKYFNVDQSS